MNRRDCPLPWALRTLPALAFALVAGCEEADLGVVLRFPADGGVAAWACPPAWVPQAIGGCAPAVLTCGGDGGAATGACGDAGVGRPLAVGGERPGWAFYRSPEGALGGGWSLGPPAATPRPVECPPGWQSDEPWRCSPRFDTCAAADWALPGGGCLPLGEESCPSEGFPDPGPEAMGAPRVHVRAGADGITADGSAARPYPTIARGLAAAGAGAWVLAAPGRYPEALTLRGTARVVGACAARSVIALPAGEDVAVRVEAGDALLRGFTVEGAGDLVVAGDGARARLEALRLRGARQDAVRAAGGGITLALRDSLIEGARRRAEGQDAHGVFVRGDADVTVERTVVTGVDDWGVQVRDGATAALRDVVIREVTSRPSVAGQPDTGLGVGIYWGARMSIQRALVERIEGEGVDVGESGARLDASEVVVRRNGPRVDGNGGKGFNVQVGASATLRRVQMLDVANTGFTVRSGATLLAEDVTVRGVRGRGAGTGGRGFDVSDGARATVRRAVFEGAHEVGVFVYDGSTLTLTDSVVRNIEPRPDGSHGLGVVVIGARPASLVAERVLVEGVHESGVAVLLSGASARLQDVIVRDVVASSRGYGLGVVAAGGATIEADRLAVERALGAGLIAEAQGLAGRVPGTALTARDVFVAGTRAGQVAVDPATMRGVGDAVAYGLYAGAVGTLRADQALVDVGQIGFVARGVVDVRAGVIARHDRFGAVERDDPSSAFRAESVRSVMNRAQITDARGLPVLRVGIYLGR